MANKHATQGALLAECLKKRRHTYAQMHAHGVSTCPQKRVVDWLKLNPAWKLDKSKVAVKGHPKPLIAWRIVKNPAHGLPF